MDDDRCGMHTKLGEQVIDRRKNTRPSGDNRWCRTRPAWWNRLHELWTKAVDTPNYNKRQWQEFEASLFKAMGLQAMTDLRKQVEGLRGYVEWMAAQRCAKATTCRVLENREECGECDTCRARKVLLASTAAGAGQLAAKFTDLAVEMEKHSNDHIHDEPNTAAAVEGVCADRIKAILKPHGPVSERFMQKHYGPSGFAKREEPPAGEPRLRESAPLESEVRDIIRRHEYGTRNEPLDEFDIALVQDIVEFIEQREKPRRAEIVLKEREDIVSWLNNLNSNWAVLRNTRSFMEGQPKEYWKKFDACMGEAFRLQIALMKSATREAGKEGK